MGKIERIFGASLRSGEQPKISYLGINLNLVTDGEARFEYLVDEACKGTVYVQARLSTSLKRMHILLLAHL